MNLEILHLADLHADKKYLDKFVKSAKQVIKYLKKNKTHYVIISGDLFEKVQNFKRDTGVQLVFWFIQEISRLVRAVVICKGNNHHDAPGSIHLLHKLQPNVYAFEKPTVLAFLPEKILSREVRDYVRNSSGEKLPFAEEFLTDPFEKCINLTESSNKGIDALCDFLRPEIIFNILPYPTKANLIKDGTIDERNVDYINILSEMLESKFAKVNNKFTCPKIMSFHANVLGAVLGKGQPSIGKELIIPPKVLKKANCSYYGGGHIHNGQIIDNDIILPGSFFNKNWGEIEQKGFNVVSFNDGKRRIQRIPLTAARPMIDIPAKFENGKIIYNSFLARPGAEHRITFTYHQAERKLLTEELFAEIRKELGDDVEINDKMIPAKREVRSKKIMEAENLHSETEEQINTRTYEISSINILPLKLEVLHKEKKEKILINSKEYDEKIHNLGEKPKFKLTDSLSEKISKIQEKVV